MEAKSVNLLLCMSYTNINYLLKAELYKQGEGQSSPENNHFSFSSYLAPKPLDSVLFNSPRSNQNQSALNLPSDNRDISRTS